MTSTVVQATLWEEPQATRVIFCPSRPWTSVGFLLTVVVPFPCWPWSLSPHAYTYTNNSQFTQALKLTVFHQHVLGLPCNMCFNLEKYRAKVRKSSSCATPPQCQFAKNVKKLAHLSSLCDSQAVQSPYGHMNNLLPP